MLRTPGTCHNIATSYTFSTRLPAPAAGNPIRLENVWAWAEAEETVGLSPAMFTEQFLPYFAQMCRLVGRVYYGCCEPMQDTLEAILRDIPNVGKVSVSSWSDEKRVGDILRGRGIVYSRKPSANLVGVAETLDEEAFARHITDTLKAAAGCPCEFIFRDIYTVHGNLAKVRRAVELTRRLAEDSFGK